MQRYAAHLLFAILAIVIGFAAGIAGGLWWFEQDTVALWVAVGAGVVGLLILILQAIYISGAPPKRSKPKYRRASNRKQWPRLTGGTLPEIEPVQSSDTRIGSVGRTTDDGEETRTSAAEALKAYQSGQRPPE